MKPWHSLAEKNVWVIGGAGYLGSAITTALDSECARTVCIDLPGKSEALVQEKTLQRTVPASFDLTATDGIEAFIDQTIQAHGLPDGVVYLVFASSRNKRLGELTKDDFQQTLDLALPPAFIFCRAIADRMSVRGSGSVVLFSSMYGVVAPDPKIYRGILKPNPIDYGATKAALLQMSRYFAVHYGPAGIRFNCVTPGPFSNPSLQKNDPEFMAELSRKTALGRIGQSAEVIGPTLFLLTDSASFVTGHSLVVDGGWTTW